MDEMGQVPFFFLLLGYLFMTTGELFISPIGLSKATELSPAKYVAFMVGVFYMSSSFAHYIAGAIAKLTVTTGSKVVEDPGVMEKIISMVTGFTNGTTDSAVAEIQQLAIYTSVFTQIGVIAIGIGCITLILSPFIKKLMHGVH